MKIKSLLTRIYIQLKQRIFVYDNLRLKYLFEQHNSSTLIIGFSGLSPKPVYNYVKTLKSIKADKLYLLDDFAYGGSYYWFSNNRGGVETVVKQLISKILSHKTYKRVITIGSSKGGTCAIYYGLTIGATDIYAGAPQYYVGKYLNEGNKIPIFQSMMGINAGKKEEIILDHKLPDVLKENKSCATTINLFYSTLEHTYKDDIQFLIKDLNENGITHYDTIEPFKNHSEVGVYFGPWLKKELSKK